MSSIDFSPPLAATGWLVYRLVASIFPPVSIFDRITDPADYEAIFTVESLTNDRLRDEVGNISLVALGDRIAGPGTTPIMAAFTHLNPLGSRFSDGSYGVYYAATTLDTAVAETRYHREKFLRFTNEGPIDIDMRAYVAQLDGELHDLRGCQETYPQIYHPTDYSAGQAVGARLRDAKSNGLIYVSVRQAPELSNTCVAVFRPPCLSECRQERHLTYRWDGSAISEIYEKREYSE